MSSDKRWTLSKVPSGRGVALDLGGGHGELAEPLHGRGYRYVNLDLAPRCDGSAVCGDAHVLPFRSDAFDVVVSSDSLEHLLEPHQALGEVRRVLKPGGTLIIWVPFMHPFHGTDYYRYTPLGLRAVLERAGLHLVSLEAPLWIFSVMAQALIALLQRVGLGSVERSIERFAARLDQRTAKFRREGMSFASAYLAVASKDPR